jgi:hypothetical protein
MGTWDTEYPILDSCQAVLSTIIFNLQNFARRSTWWAIVPFSWQGLSFMQPPSPQTLYWRLPDHQRHSGFVKLLGTVELSKIRIAVWHL